MEEEHALALTDQNLEEVESSKEIKRNDTDNPLNDGQAVETTSTDSKTAEEISQTMGSPGLEELSDRLEEPKQKEISNDEQTGIGKDVHKQVEESNEASAGSADSGEQKDENYEEKSDNEVAQESTIQTSDGPEETPADQSARADIEDDEGKEQRQHNDKATAEVTDSDVPVAASSPVKDDATNSSSKETKSEKKSQERTTQSRQSKTVPKSYGRPTRKDIAEKFGGVATSANRVQRSTSYGANSAKNMLLEWCKAKTRGCEGVDVQNFSSSWSNGLAFCALIVAYFPDAFDFSSLDPKNRRHNFQLAFSTAENLADCPPLLDVEDMVHMKVPDSKCVYTYVQELYRSLIAKGLIKTKKT